MQFEYRNFGTPREYGPKVLKYLKPKEIQKVAGNQQGGGQNGERPTLAKMTLSVVWRGPKPNFVAPASGRFRRGSVDQQDRDAVLNGIDAVAYTALQTFPVFFQDHRLLAHRADEDVEKILGNHSGSIVAPKVRRNTGFICDRIAFLQWSQVPSEVPSEG